MAALPEHWLFVLRCWAIFSKSRSQVAESWISFESFLMVSKTVPGEIYVISHHVHHCKSDEPVGPLLVMVSSYAVSIVGWGCACNV